MMLRELHFLGSFDRGEQKEYSDIDIPVEFKYGKSLLDLAGLKIELEEALGRKVDVLTYNSLHPSLRDRILQEQKVISYEKKTQKSSLSIFWSTIYMSYQKCSLPCKNT